MKKKGLFFIFLILIINLSYIDSARCFWSNCLNCGNDYLGDCKICADGYYINSVGACFKCWDNCLDCGNDRTGRCKICEDGYYINSVGGCFKNDENDENDEFSEGQRPHKKSFIFNNLLKIRDIKCPRLLEEQWKYEKILLDYNIIDFTSKKI